MKNNNFQEYNALKQNINLTNRIVLTPVMQQRLKILSLDNNQLTKFLEDFTSTNPFVKLKIHNPRNEVKNLDWIRDNHKETLVEHLSRQLYQIKSSSNIIHIVKYMIFNLDYLGYLPETNTTLAVKINCSVRDIKKAREILAHLDPLGIGTQNLTERLLVQAYSEKDFNKLALKLLKENKLKVLAKPADWRNSKWSQYQLHKALASIKKLNPNPQMDYSTQQDIPLLIPDLIFKIRGTKILVIDSKLNYPELVFDTKKFKTLYNDNLSFKDKQYFNMRRNDYKTVNKALLARNHTLKEVGEFLVKYQYKYLMTLNDVDLKKLTLKMAATSLNLSISTISRTVKGKYFQCKNVILPLKKLFYSKAINNYTLNKIKELLKQIFKNEDKKNPLSDKQIQNKLENMDVKISRRTVSKYRKLLKIKNSYLRKC